VIALPGLWRVRDVTINLVSELSEASKKWRFPGWLVVGDVTTNITIKKGFKNVRPTIILIDKFNILHFLSLHGIQLQFH
jgi:hypothetical protein